MNEKVDLAFNQVVGLVEPLTRFDRNSLARESGRERVSAGKAFWRFSPSFSVERDERAGHLPSYVTHFGSSSALEDAVRQARAVALDSLPPRIEKWLRINAQTDKKLEPADCFDGPKTFGHEFDCSPCSGKGWVTCGTCDGKRLLTCNGGCGGSGRKNCSKCGANGEVKCRMCSGKGKMPSGAKCGTCKGRGKIVCPGCNGDRKVSCNTCGGTGKINCPRCDATGRLTCQNCDGSGRRHALRVLKCEVGHAFRVEPKDEKTEVAGLLRGLSLNELRALARVTQMPPAVEANVVRREYTFECDITEIKLKAADSGLELIGYGPRAQIFEFKSIVTILLEADLKTLKMAVSVTPRRLWGIYPALLDATRQSLASEANAT